MVLEYVTRSNELWRLAVRIIDMEENKAIRFEQGLCPNIQSDLAPFLLSTYTEVLQ